MRAYGIGLSQWSLGLAAAIATTDASASEVDERTCRGLESVVWEWQLLGLGLPGIVLLMVLVARGYRDKWGLR